MSSATILLGKVKFKGSKVIKSVKKNKQKKHHPITKEQTTTKSLNIPKMSNFTDHIACTILKIPYFTNAAGSKELKY